MKGGTDSPGGGQRGQALPLGLVGLLLACLLFGLCLRLGARLLQRERVRLRTDLTALSAGVLYARSLNLLALTQQAAGAAGLATLLTAGSAYGSLAAVQRLQKAVLLAAPWMTEAGCLYLAWENGLAALPLWNRRALLEDTAGALEPDLNVSVLGLAGGLAKALQGLLQLGGAGEALSAGELEALVNKSGALSGTGAENLLRRWLPAADRDRLTTITGYRQVSGGRERILSAEQAGPVRERQGQGSTTRYKSFDDHTYVAPIRGIDPALPLGLWDEGHHYLTLLALQGPDRGRPWERPGWSLALAQVQVAGGSLALGDLGGSRYGPCFVPLRLLPGENGAPRRQELGGRHGFGADLPGLQVRLPAEAGAGQPAELEAARAAAAALDLAGALGADPAWLGKARAWADLIPQALALRH